MNKESKFAVVLFLVAAIATSAIVLTLLDQIAQAKSNKAFGKCVSAAKGNQTKKLACNSLKRGHPFTVHPAENETS